MSVVAWSEPSVDSSYCSAGLGHRAAFIELAGDPLNGRRAIATGGRAGVSDAEFRLPVFEIGFQHGDGFVGAADGVVLASALLEPSLRLGLWLSCLPQHTIALRIGFSVFCTAAATENGCRVRRDPSTAGRPVESHRDILAQPPYFSTQTHILYFPILPRS